MSQKKSNEIVEKSLGLKFKDKALLHKALIHRSYLNENLHELESNERLEFLGDAILEFVVSDYLYKKFSKEDEGHLTTLRARLVDTTSLASTALELNLGEAIYLSRGEERGSGRTNKGLLADTLEAVIGALFLDQGLQRVSTFIEKTILKNIPEIVKKSLKDPKSLLQEYVQAAGFSTPSYKVVSESGPDHLKSFTVEVLVDKKPFARGSGSSKQLATQVAATNALVKWSNHS
ncbi:MAG: ribonuclease III [bacterium]|nr:ribonuclease III [bacterium]